MTAKFKTVYEDRWPDGQIRSSVTRSWNTQMPPFLSPLSWGFSRRVVNVSESSAGPYYRGVDDHPIVDFTHVLNNSWDKLQSAIGDQSSWGTNLAEARQATDTVTKHALALAGFASNLHKGNLYGAYRDLTNDFFNNVDKSRGHRGFGPVRNKGKNFSKDFAGAFLEGHFGWEPMMDDIHSACQTMSKADFGFRYIHGSGSDSSSTDTRHQDDFWTFTRAQTKTDLRFKQGCRVRISNESAFLASQMGLINPATVAWDLVPFSFVVDWFANVGQVLGAMTGFVGLDVDLAYHTQSQQFFYHTETTSDNHVDYIHTAFEEDLFAVGRSPGLVGPSLEVKPFKGFSPTRGATAMALLLQQLR